MMVVMMMMMMTMNILLSQGMLDFSCLSFVGFECGVKWNIYPSYTKYERLYERGTFSAKKWYIKG